jgi:hypothetical protein
MANAFVAGIKKAFPFISAAASLGGPFGVMAASVVGKALGVDKAPDSTGDGITNAIAAAMVDPAQRAALLKAEQDFQAQMAELGYKDAEEMEQIAADDRASARNREIQVRDRTPEIGFYALVFLLTAVLVALFKVPIPADNKAVVFTLAGALVGLVTAAGNYFYGTSRGSERKTELLAQAPPIASKP